MSSATFTSLDAVSSGSSDRAAMSSFLHSAASSRRSSQTASPAEEPIDESAYFTNAYTSAITRAIASNSSDDDFFDSSSARRSRGIQKRLSDWNNKRNAEANKTRINFTENNNNTITQNNNNNNDISVILEPFRTHHIPPNHDDEERAMPTSSIVSKLKLPISIDRVFERQEVTKLTKSAVKTMIGSLVDDSTWAVVEAEILTARSQRGRKTTAAEDAAREKAMAEARLRRQLDIDRHQSARQRRQSEDILNATIVSTDSGDSSSNTQSDDDELIDDKLLKRPTIPRINADGEVIGQSAEPSPTSASNITSTAATAGSSLAPSPKSKKKRKNRRMSVPDRERRSSLSSRRPTKSSIVSFGSHVSSDDTVLAKRTAVMAQLKKVHTRMDAVDLMKRKRSMLHQIKQIGGTKSPANNVRSRRTSLTKADPPPRTSRQSVTSQALPISSRSPKVSPPTSRRTSVVKSLRRHSQSSSKTETANNKSNNNMSTATSSSTAENNNASTTPVTTLRPVKPKRQTDTAVLNSFKPVNVRPMQAAAPTNSQVASESSRTSSRTQSRRQSPTSSNTGTPASTSRPTTANAQSPLTLPSIHSQRSTATSAVIANITDAIKASPRRQTDAPRDMMQSISSVSSASSSRTHSRHASSAAGLVSMLLRHPTQMNNTNSPFSAQAAPAQTYIASARVPTPQNKPFSPQSLTNTLAAINRK